MSIVPFHDKITLYKGSTFDETWTFYEDDAATVLEDLSSYTTAAMKIRATFDSPVLLALTNGTPSSSQSAIVLGGALGTIRVYVTDDDSAALNHDSFTVTTEDGVTRYTGVFDIEVANAGGERFRRVMGSVTFSLEVTY